MISIEQWLIVSKDRRWIAVGTPRNRKLILVNEYKGDRVLTYKNKGVAENAFKNNWFYVRCSSDLTRPTKEDLEAVKFSVEYKEIT